jgi:hypothetical protein
MPSRIKIMGWVVLGVLVAAIAAGCGETTEPETDAPQLPPLQSMQMDLSFFTEGSGQGAAPTAAEPAGTKLNFLNAVVRAAFVNVAVVTVLTPPALAFSAALHTFPSREDDGSYLWIYTWVHQGQDHQIRLRGTPAGVHVDWELYVVLPGHEAQLWFSGRSYRDRDEGFWVFRDFSAEGDPEVLRIDWEVNSEQDATLEFRNIHAGSDEEGDELRYRAEGPMNSIEFLDASSTETWDIIWNEADGSGSLQVPDYNNGQRACWDTNQDDASCPEAAGSFLAAGER